MQYRYTDVSGNFYMDRELEDIRNALTTLSEALTSETEEEWDKIINSKKEDNNKKDNLVEICVRIYGELILRRDGSSINATRFLVATYDNIKITIDNTNNHKRPHIHIGIKKDKYHSASIAIDNGDILNNTRSIPDWKVKRIIKWMTENKEVIEKIYRCINPWGDVESAERRTNKLNDL